MRHARFVIKNTQDDPWQPVDLFPMGSMLNLNSVVPKDYELTDYCWKVAFQHNRYTNKHAGVRFMWIHNYSLGWSLLHSISVFDSMFEQSIPRYTLQLAR